MYCKNCGRHLKEGTRFCDRCGQSVRKSGAGAASAKRREIEALQTERLNRKKRLEEKEAKRAQNKKRKKSGGRAFGLAVVVLALAVLSVVLGYKIMSPSRSTDTIAATDTPQASTAQLTETASPDMKTGYTSITIGSITCPYPSAFHSNTVSGNQKLNLTDALSGATLIVTQEGKSGSVNDLMREFARETGGEVSYSRAGSDWYALTAEAEGKIYHRKLALRNGIAVYYDFTYDASSTSAQKYEEYIEYIDANFK